MRLNGWMRLQTRRRVSPLSSFFLLRCVHSPLRRSLSFSSSRKSNRSAGCYYNRGKKAVARGEDLPSSLLLMFVLDRGPRRTRDRQCERERERERGRKRERGEHTGRGRGLFLTDQTRQCRSRIALRVSFSKESVFV